MFQQQLGSGYELLELETDSFVAFQGPQAEALFAGELPTMFRYRDTLSEAEAAKVAALRARCVSPYRLNLVALHDGELAGWTWGLQEGGDSFYMCNSAVLPAHRGRGLYQALLAATIEVTTALGFQRLYSRHVATNNAVIVPKLKAGFVITGLELSDTFGMLVQLGYFPGPARRKVLAFRAGQAGLDDELRTHLRL